MVEVPLLVVFLLPNLFQLEHMVNVGWFIVGRSRALSEVKAL